MGRHLTRFPAVDGLVVTSTQGRPWRRRTFAELICQAREDAGLAASATFHDLRHHYASALIAAGCSIKAVQSALGHKNASETLDTYSNLWPADEDRLRDAVQALHGPSRVTGCRYNALTWVVTVSRPVSRIL